LSVELSLLDGDLAVVRLDAGAGPPPWARAGATGLLSVTTAPGETSVVCDAAGVPGGADPSGPWRALAVAGPLDHALTGILAAIATPLADAGVPIFAVSTFDTDYVLVPAEHVSAAVAALLSAGHRVDAPDGGD
jgi:uncharacterized protein